MNLNVHVKYKHDFYSEYVHSGLVEFTAEQCSGGEEGWLPVWYLRAGWGRSRHIVRVWLSVLQKLATHGSTSTNNPDNMI